MSIPRSALVSSVISCLVAASVLLSCSTQSPPPGLQATEVVSIIVWVRDETTWYLQQRLAISSEDDVEIEKFADAWTKLETLRPPPYPESPDGAIEVDVSLTEGRHWKLMWQPAYGEAVFTLIGSGTPEMVDRSPMKLHSEDTL